MCSYCWMCQVVNSRYLNTTFLLSEYQWSAYGDDLPQERRFGWVRAIAVDIIIRVAVAVGATDRCCCSTVATVPQCGCPVVVVVAIVGYLVACRQWECSEGSARRRGLLLSRVLVLLMVVVVVMILRQYHLGLLLVEVVYRYRW